MTFAVPPWAEPAADRVGELGALLTFTLPNGAAALAQFHIRFDARPEEQLVGCPAALFNTPRPGEPLVATLPQLAHVGLQETNMIRRSRRSPLMLWTLIIVGGAGGACMETAPGANGPPLLIQDICHEEPICAVIPIDSVAMQAPRPHGNSASGGRACDT